MTSESLFSDLNPAQKEAVTHVGGPLVVVAGAGSGKTRVLTRRIAYLMISLFIILLGMSISPYSLKNGPSPAASAILRNLSMPLCPMAE